MNKIKKYKNIIYKQIKHLKSVNFSVFIRSSSLNETYKNNGISHLIEHLLFKETINKTGREIALEFDKIGGDINAYTNADYTCIHIKTLTEDIYKGVDLIFEMLFDSKITEKGLRLEKDIIYDEIESYEDDAEDLILHSLNEMFFGDQAFKYNVLGRKDSLKAIPLEEVETYKNRYYCLDNMVISLVGNFEEDLIEHLDGYLEDFVSKNMEIRKNPQFLDRTGRLDFVDKNFEQVTGNISLGKRVDYKEYKYELIVLNNILGGTSSSRLFQTIREDKGLTYHINSFVYDNELEANINIMFTSEEKNAPKISQAILEELENFKDYTLSLEELNMHKKQLVAEFILSMEDPYEDMIFLGEKFLLEDKISDGEDVIESIKTIELEKLIYLKDSIFNSLLYNIVYVGEISSDNKKKIKNIINNR